MIEQHPDQLIDYVLKLLPPEQEQQIEQQAAADLTLRRQLTAEREIGQLVRATISQAAAPEPARLRQLMPAPPTQGIWLTWQRPLAMAGAFLLMLLVAFGWREARSYGAVPGTAPGVAVTVTQTEAPTHTMTHTVEANGGLAPLIFGTRVWREPAGNNNPMPFPAATPIAALSLGTP
ncbi:MAG: hypothetical protein KDE04_02620 [Anaerolineales bacterium]|nr:hypothetical protein [Anaerolineales bacterium]